MALDFWTNLLLQVLPALGGICGSSNSAKPLSLGTEPSPSVPLRSTRIQSFTESFAAHGFLGGNGKWQCVKTYKYHFLWDEHPFTSYFDVHQGYKVLTHCQINASSIKCSKAHKLCIAAMSWSPPVQPSLALPLPSWPTSQERRRCCSS